MHLGAYQVPVPIGLSELINCVGAWSTDEVPYLVGYQREVKRDDDRLVTVLTYVGDHQ